MQNDRGPAWFKMQRSCVNVNQFGGNADVVAYRISSASSLFRALRGTLTYLGWLPSPAQRQAVRAVQPKEKVLRIITLVFISLLLITFQDGHVSQRPRVLRIRHRWCQLWRSAWSSITNCEVTGAPQLSEKAAARSSSSSVNSRTASDAFRLF